MDDALHSDLFGEFTFFISCLLANQVGQQLVSLREKSLESPWSTTREVVQDGSATLLVLWSHPRSRMHLRLLARVRFVFAAIVSCGVSRFCRVGSVHDWHEGHVRAGTDRSSRCMQLRDKIRQQPPNGQLY